MGKTDSPLQELFEVPCVLGRKSPRPLTLTRILGGLCVGLLSAPSPAVGDPPPANVQLVAKVDARQLFATSRQQWHEKVRHAAASGMATPLRQPGARSVGMSVRAAHGTVSTVLRYDMGDANPSAVLFAVAYRPGEAAFTGPSAEKVIALVKRQLAPEFHVVGHTDFVDDRFALFFFITESHTARARTHATAHPPRPGRPPAKHDDARAQRARRNNVVADGTRLAAESTAQISKNAW